MGRYYLYCKKADFLAIAQKYNISPMTARILRNRDLITDDEIDLFLNGSMDDLFDPFLMKGIEEAIPIILKAVSDNVKIRIIGDYDVDGICSSYILKRFISFLGGDVDVRLPDRMLEGYGLNSNMIVEAKNDEVHLIITCDNGVSSYEAVNLANELGIDIIVTDHHEVPYPLVNADVVIDPKQEGCNYPYKNLCGAGVAYKLVSALAEKTKKKGYRTELYDLIQYAGMATIADIVPLTGENRIIAKEGIKKLQITENQGLLALMDARSIKPKDITSRAVGFILGPCINSAGRLRNAGIAYDLFEEENPEAAKERADFLSKLNDERKLLTISQAKNAIDIINDSYIKPGLELPKVLVVYLPEAHESIAGIIAGRLKDIYSRPALVLTNSEDGIKGSGRSVDAYDIISEMAKFPELFQKFGGHKKAAGFSLKEGVTPEDLAVALNGNCDLSPDELTEKIWIDMQLPFKYITEGFINELSLLEPYGLMNDRPLFAQKNVRIRFASVLGKGSNVLKASLEDEDGTVMEAIKFGNENEIRKEAEELFKGMETEGDQFRISILFYPEMNFFRDKKNPQVRIISFI